MWQNQSSGPRGCREEKKAEDAKKATEANAKKNVADEAKAVSAKASEAKAAADPFEAKEAAQKEAAKKAHEAKVQALLNQEKSIKLQIAALNGHTEPELLKAKAALQADLTKCNHERTMLKPVEDRVTAMKTAVATCEIKVVKTQEIQLEASGKAAEPSSRSRCRMHRR